MTTKLIISQTQMTTKERMEAILTRYGLRPRPDSDSRIIEVPQPIQGEQEPEIIIPWFLANSPSNLTCPHCGSTKINCICMGGD